MAIQVPSANLECFVLPSEFEQDFRGSNFVSHPKRKRCLLLDAWEFVPALEKFHAAGKPIFGTCAGLILLAREVESPKQMSLGLIDLTAERNAYGRQKESFETEGVADLGQGLRPLKMVFIRAPRIRRMGASVAPLVMHRGECVMAREGSVLVAAFHPELTDDETVHRYFASMVRQAAG